MVPLRASLHHQPLNLTDALEQQMLLVLGPWNLEQCVITVAQYPIGRTRIGGSRHELQVGEQLHVLLQQALAAVEAQDVRQLKTAIEAWSTWDKQMRTNHHLEDEKSQKPLVDIRVMAALPSMEEMRRRQPEREETVEVEAA